MEFFRFYKWIGTVLGVLLLAGALKCSAGRRMTVVSDSMIPLLQRGDVVSINSYRNGKPKVGDMVAYDHPKLSSGIWYSPRWFILRVIAVENEIPILKDGTKMTPVPVGYVFVVADNQQFQEDSRSFGPLEISRIKGRVASISLPRSRKREFK